jgi:bifunctional non-homologous end joining protein LigD
VRESGGSKLRELTRRRKNQISSTPHRAGKHKKLLATMPGARLARIPKEITPMLATLVDEPFDDPEWLFETKWDGVRALCYLQRGEIELITRNGKEVAFRYPELAGISTSLKAAEAILDGEIVTLDKRGRSVFQWLQSRIGLKNEADIAAAARTHPAIFCVFDLLYCDGYDLRGASLKSRKDLLSTLLQSSDHMRLSEHVLGKGKKRFKKAEQEQTEGIIAKLTESPYIEGRSSSWLKIKTTLRQEVVIAGYTAPLGSRKFFGALLAGLYQGKELHYVGHIGGGFDHASLKQVYEALQPIETKKSPFKIVPRTNTGARWVEPRLVCEVKFAEWTAAGLMRQPIFEGLRDDKSPNQCRLEQAHHVNKEKNKAEKARRGKA